MDFVDQKNASDPCAVVMSSFGGTKRNIFFPDVVLRETADCSVCLELVRVCFVPVSVRGCEGVTVVPLSLLEISNCPINNLSVIYSVFSHHFSSDDNRFFVHKTFDFCSDQSFLGLWRIFCTCHRFFSSLQLSLPLPITIIIINYSACTYRIIVILFCFS